MSTISLPGLRHQHDLHLPPIMEPQNGSSSSSRPASSRPRVENVILTTLFVINAIAGLWYVRIAGEAINLGQQLQDVLKDGHYADGTKARTHFTGIAPIDSFLSVLVVAFMFGASGWDKGARIQQWYFLFEFTPVVTLMTMESCRNRSRGTILYYTSIWAFLYQTVGGAFIIPLYYLAYAHQSSKVSFHTDYGKAIPLHMARAILPSIAIGYLLPTMLVYWPRDDLDHQIIQQYLALWQPAPLYVNALMWIISTILAMLGSSTTSTPPPSTTTSQDKSQLALTLPVAVSFQASLAAHAVMLSSTYLTQPATTLSHVHLPYFSFKGLDVGPTLHAVFQWDFWLITVATLLWAVVGVSDFNRVRKHNVSMIKALVWLVGGSIVVGPGTMTLAMWMWFEVYEVWGTSSGKATAGLQEKKTT